MIRLLLFITAALVAMGFWLLTERDVSLSRMGAGVLLAVAAMWATWLGMTVRR